MPDPFIGEIRTFGFPFAPPGYMECKGDLIPISSQQALYSLVGTYYGGDGRTSFAIPDLRGRSPVSMGAGPGLQFKQIGQYGGLEVAHITVSQLPAHNHKLYGSAEEGDSADPLGRSLAKGGSAAFSGSVPAGIPVSGTTTIQGKTGALQNGQTSASSGFSGSVDAKPYVYDVPDREMQENSIGYTGSNAGLYTRSPYLGMLFVIALEGVYPSRN